MGPLTDSYNLIDAGMIVLLPDGPHNIATPHWRRQILRTAHPLARPPSSLNLSFVHPGGVQLPP